MTPQNVAADPSAHVFVTANAGSGKTSTLVNRVARLLLRGARPEHILCATYTKAAAAEMQGRLFAQLGGWAVMPDDELSQQLAKIGEDISAENLTRARTLFAGALETPGGLKIQTIHGFCEKLLRRFPLEAGLSPSFKILDDLEAKALKERAQEQLLTLHDDKGVHGDISSRDRLIRTLRINNFEKLLRQFCAQHEDITEQFEELKLKAESEGSNWIQFIYQSLGFDQVVTPEQIERNYLRGLNWEAIGALTRSVASVNDVTNQKISSALLSFCEANLRGEEFDATGFAAIFLKKDGHINSRIYTQKTLASDREIIDKLAQNAFTFNAQHNAAKIAFTTFDVLRLFMDFSAIYRTLKRRSGALDFQDLIVQTRRLLHQTDMSSWVLYKLDGGLEHILVDEAQDTSEDQWAIVKALTSEFFAGEGASLKLTKAIRTVFAVGDEKQSIYGFQGARPDKFLETRQYYDMAAVSAGQVLKVPELVHSFRSLPQVLGFVDAVYDGDPELSYALTFTSNVVRHAAVRNDIGCIELWPQVMPIDADDTEDDGTEVDPVDKTGATPAKRLAQQLAFHIKSEIAIGRGVMDKGHWRAMHAGDVLILVRKRDALFENIIRELKQQGVPVSGADRLKLSEHIAFQDIRTLMRFAMQPGDDLSLACVLRSPLCDLSEQDLYDLSQGRSGSLWAALLQKPSDGDRFDDARALMHWALAEAPKRAAFDFLARLLNRRDRSGLTMRQRFPTRLGPECEDVLDETLALALKGEGIDDIGVEAFLNLCEFNASDIKREQEEGGERVRVMTVHGSKGLEAPWVIIPIGPNFKSSRNDDLLLMDDDGGLFVDVKPERGKVDAITRFKDAKAEKDEQEALRLFYVALTRARDRLTVCGYQGKRAGIGRSWYGLAADAFSRLPVGEVSAVDMPLRADFGLDDPGRAQVLVYGARAGTYVADEKSLRAKAPLPEFLTAGSYGEDDPSAVWRAVSQMGDDDRTETERSPSPLAMQKGLGRYRRGNLIHKLFEILPDLAPDQREAVAVKYLAKQTDLDDDQRAEITGAVMAVLNDDRFAEAFSPRSRPEVALAGQIGVSARGEPVYLSGRIDRLVVSDDHVWVIDYKSSRPAPDLAEDAAIDYQRQMAGYVALLRQIYPKAKVEAALLWTDGPKLTPFSDDLITVRLAELSR
ncbi:double-strand break repair helicase AddA [Asticcacaulis sp. ZE23SCel15]|uniref:double-strand break repair helicase AddA n=1 Tax=Asticcacaulis sp. ZE23SCel15 TaxID=3059027 RepID=UPI0026602ED9|nr:double-strand break repair helicase AddA [Asticcacaulis sp. ZE23SCel15]WKL58221.1 double-strand break repair helicase AddA [Asticcacaulis sp. ZE23SCel15]